MTSEVRTSNRRILLGLLVAQLTAAALNAASWACEYIYKVNAGVISIAPQLSLSAVFLREFTSAFYLIVLFTIPTVYIIGYIYTLFLENRGIKSFWAYAVVSLIFAVIHAVLFEQTEFIKFLKIIAPTFVATLIFWGIFIKK